MTNADIQGALASFQEVASDGSALKDKLAALGTAGISDDDEAALQALAALATQGESLLASGASKARDDEIQAITNQIQGLQAAIALGGDQDAINGQIAELTAKRAGLLQEKVGDFSDIIDAATVGRLVALAVQVHNAAEMKQKAAAIIGLVQQVVTTATDVAAAVAKVA